MRWTLYGQNGKGKEMANSGDYDPTEGYLPEAGKNRKLKKHPRFGTQTAGGDPGVPAGSNKNVGKQAVQRKLKGTTASIPFQKVDWPTRSQHLKRLTQLRIEKTTWVPHWMDLSWFILPRQSRFTSTDRNLGYRKDRFIINSRATRNVKRAAAGMMSGISSPSRPWFNMTTRDPDLAKFDPVKEWLGQVADRIRSTMAKSNFYKGIHQIYKHLLVWGTACGFIEENLEDAIRLFVQPIGSYSLAQSGDCRVDTVYREISLTIGQLVDKFGIENCSNWVQWMWGKGNYDFWTYVVHAVEPNRRVDNMRWESRFSPIRSAWFELGAYSGSYGFDTSDSGYSGEPLNFLLESGYKESPFIAPRWETTGMEDVYGESPAMDCLGDIRSLQKYEAEKAKMVSKLVSPPMKGPASLRAGRASILPGDFTAVDESGSKESFRPAMEIPPEGIREAREDIKEILQRIDDHFLMDVWVMFLNQADDPRKTATEIQALKDEKLQQLGPVLENIHGEVHGPAINRIFNILWRRGELPPVPQELRGHELDVEYISTAAQAQKAIGLQALQTTVAFTQSLVELGRPDAVDNLNVDALVEKCGDLVGLEPSLLVPPEKLQALRAQRAQQQAQAARMQQMEQSTKAAKNLAGADTSGDNGLSRLLAGMGQGPGVAA